MNRGPQFGASWSSSKNSNLTSGLASAFSPPQQQQQQQNGVGVGVSGGGLNKFTSSMPRDLRTTPPSSSSLTAANSSFVPATFNVYQRPPLSKEYIESLTFPEFTDEYVSRLWTKEFDLGTFIPYDHPEVQNRFLLKLNSLRPARGGNNFQRRF